MKVSEMIKLLQEKQDKVGDVEVEVSPRMYPSMYPSSGAIIAVICSCDNEGNVVDRCTKIIIS